MNALPLIPGYRILKHLGEGGYGSVYLVESEVLKRREAIKILHGHISQADQDRLRREAETVARIQHPAVATVYAFGSFAADGIVVHYISMEYVEGKSLLDATTRELLLSLSFRRRIEHFENLCDAVNYFHSRGIVHGDLSLANVIYSDRVDQIKIVDFGIAAETPQAGNSASVFERDVKALGRLFLQCFCVPLISTYRDRVGQACSVQDILNFLANLRQAGPPSIGVGPDPDHGIRREAYGADAAVRYDELLFRFCRCFPINTRVAFGPSTQLTTPYERSEDQAARRVHIYYHPLLPFTSTDQLIILDALARVFQRDVTFRFRAWLQGKIRSGQEPLPQNRGFSDAPRATEGLSAKDLMEGLASMFVLPDEEAQQKAAEGYQVTLKAIMILQLLQAGVLYNRLIHLASSGYFGEYTPCQVSERILASWREKSLFGKEFMIVLAGVNSELKLGINPDQVAAIAYILHTVPNRTLTDREATRKLLEHLLWLMLPEPLMSLRVDEGFTLFPSLVFLTAEHGRVVHYDGAVLRFAGKRQGEVLSVPASFDDLVTLRALIEFEQITRSPVTQSYDMDRMALYGRRGIGNILSINSHYIKPSEHAWNQIIHLLIEKCGGRCLMALQAKLERLLSLHEMGIVQDARDGRLFVSDGATELDHEALQSAGIVPVLHFSQEAPHVFLKKWMSERTIEAGGRIQALLNEIKRESA